MLFGHHVLQRLVRQLLHSLLLLLVHILFTAFRSTAGSCENLHLSPFLQRFCLKKAQRIDLGSTPDSTFWVGTALNRDFISCSLFAASSFSFFALALSSSSFFS